MGKRILSVQTSTLGHATYARLLREYFADAPQSPIELDSVWLEDGRDTSTRVLGRLIGLQIPGTWARERNVDLRRSRAEMLLGIMGRRLTQRQQTAYQGLHFHTQVAAYGSASLMRRVPTVVTGDMTAAQIARQEMASAAWQWTHAPSRAMDRRVFRAARAIAMWSDWAARSVIEDYGIEPDKVETIYPGVNMESLSAFDKDFSRARVADVGQGALVKLLFVGGDFERKGGPNLLEVWKHEFASQTELHLVTGAQVNHDHPNLKVHRDVRAYSPQWFQLFRESDIFVLPTLGEAFGLALIEAMAMELPVISTRLNAIPEIVADGETGFLMEPGNKRELTARIRDLVGNAELLRRMGERGGVVARQKFDARRNFKRLEQVLKEI